MASTRRTALRGLKVVASAIDAVLPRRRGVVVLLYHRVGGGSGSEIDLAPSVFADQLAAVRDRVVPLGDALDRLATAAPPAGVDPLAITFDDGTADVIEHALPALVDAGVHATLYLATGFVDGGIPLPYGGRPVSWRALADAVATGHLAVGSHTHGHLLLDRLDPGVAAADLDRSIGLVEDHLGLTPVDFAYPKAVVPSPAVEALVRARFRSAALSGTRPNPYGTTDPWRLRRSPVQVADGMRWFRSKVDGGMVAEDVVRVGLNRLRYARATT